MRRRDVFRLLAGAMIAAPYRVAAQTAAKTYRLAMLTSGPAFPANSPVVMFLMGALAEHGYKLGQNLDFQSYGADGQLARLPQIARDVAASKVDAVVVAGWPPTAAMKSTGVPTVVAVGAGDPVASGLVASLARPGGNVAGVSDNATTLSTKRLELLKQAVPSIRKVAMLWNKDDLGMTLRYQASAVAAESSRHRGSTTRRRRAGRFCRRIRGDGSRAAGTRSSWWLMHLPFLIASACSTTPRHIVCRRSMNTISLSATAA